MRFFCRHAVEVSDRNFFVTFRGRGWFFITFVTFNYWQGACGGLNARERRGATPLANIKKQPAYKTGCFLFLLRS